MAKFYRSDQALGSDNNDEVRYCHLCQKDERKNECSYGGNAWEMASRKPMSEDHIPIAMGSMLDSEGAMIKNQLQTIERSVELLREQIKGDDMQVPAWVQAKITLATESILTCANYMSGKDESVSESKNSKGKEKGIDGKACWKGYKYAGTENGKDKCVKEQKTFENFMNESAAWTRKSGKHQAAD